MIYSGSIVFVEPENLEDAKNILEGFSEIDIHAVSEDGKRIVVSVETESDNSLDELTKKIKSYDQIVDIGHHIMHFEDEIDDFIDGKKIPDMKGFFRSKRHEKNPLER